MIQSNQLQRSSFLSENMSCQALNILLLQYQYILNLISSSICLVMSVFSGHNSDFYIDSTVVIVFVRGNSLKKCFYYFFTFDNKCFFFLWNVFLNEQAFIYIAERFWEYFLSFNWSIVFCCPVENILCMFMTHGYIYIYITIKSNVREILV